MIRAGGIQGPFESSQELSRRHRNRKQGFVPRNQPLRWGLHYKHPVVSVTYSEEASFHSGLSALSKARPFSSPRKYRKLSGDDTVSLINSSMDSDDMAWRGMSTNHSLSENSDEAHKQGKMAKIWSLACLLNCPRQKRVPVSSDVYLDRSAPLRNVTESFDLVGKETCMMHSPTHFDFANFDFREQDYTFESGLSPFWGEVFETSMYSADLFSEPGHNSDSSSQSSQCSANEIVKEQHEFALMLEFWLRQAQMTVERDIMEEKSVPDEANASTNEDKENAVDRNAGEDCASNEQIVTKSTALASNNMVIVDETIIIAMDDSDVIAADDIVSCEQRNQSSCLVRTNSCSLNDGDAVQTLNDHMENVVEQNACEHVDKESVTDDQTIRNSAVLQECGNVSQYSTQISGMLKAPEDVLVVEKEKILTESKKACENLENQDRQCKSGNELEKSGVIKRDRGHIENLILFWNKSEPKPLGKPRCSVSHHEQEDDKDTSASTNGLKNDFMSRLTAGRIQASRQQDQTSASRVNGEDWLSRLTVSRTRLNETFQKPNSSESAAAATASIPIRTNGVQRNRPLHERAIEKEEEISFWNPRLFGNSDISRSASICSTCSVDRSLSSVKSDSSTSWFGNVGLDPIADDGSIRRRLQNYKAEKDPEDADFEESRQRSSPPLMLEEIDNLVTQLSKDYVQALSGLNVSR